MTDSLIFFLKEYKRRLEYSDESFLNFLNEYAAKNSQIPEFIKSCRSYAEHSDLPQAWNNALNETDEMMTNEEKLLMLSFGRNIGTSDKNSQAELISYITSRLEQSLKDKKEKEKNEKRLSYMTGLMLGVLAFIIII